MRGIRCPGSTSDIGTCAESERVHYPDVDFMMERDASGRRYFRKSGERIES